MLKNFRFRFDLLIVIFVLLMPFTKAQAMQKLNTEQSFYLGETKLISLPLTVEQIDPLIWQIDSEKLKPVSANDLIIVQPSMNSLTKQLDVKIIVPYIAPSFEALPILITGKDSKTQEKIVELTVVLTVRAELVIRFRPANSEFLSKTLSEQSDSVFSWDLPMDPKTGDYTPITVNNHPSGLWVRFRYESSPSEQLKRDGGYLIHIYRGEGEYIVHQPFDDKTHLLRADCPFEPLQEEEWKNPEIGLTAKGKAWGTCEFRGFVPYGTAYGFGFREHYLEQESHKKLVQIKNLGELNKDLVDYYKFLEENGLGLSALCTSW